MEISEAHTPVGDQIPSPHAIALAEPPNDRDPILGRSRRSILLGFIHQRRFHLPLIRALDGIELHASFVPPDRTIAQTRYKSCGAPIPHPPLCTRCRTYL